MFVAPDKEEDENGDDKDVKINGHQMAAESEVKDKPEVKVKAADKVTLSALQDSIKKVKDGPPCLTSICLYSVINTYQGYARHFMCFIFYFFRHH